VFDAFGEKWGKGDVVGIYLTFEDDKVVFGFSLNGEDQGDAFEIPKDDLEGKALFPHILAKNVKFEVNFGLAASFAPTDAWKPPLSSDFIQIAHVLSEKLTRGTPRLETREECEVIMMIGLPGSGKTTWVNSEVEANPEKHYNVINTNSLLDKMTINGECRRKHTDEDKWESVWQAATRCLQELMRQASMRRRNVIIDQLTQTGETGLALVVS